ncbi:hypothetical protein JM93_00802 [Roseibium hamelinense]|uniref:MOSC domain-containing protein n=2 Tax=Roseibium hamelinense TaxID=150831 RepID=A0A562THW5_9HYPH|nr:hypothetical protein JM93_00802 [Roseibium hamelinense]
MVDERGISGDRIYAITDTRGKLGSGKSTNTFQRIDNLLSMQAASRDGTTFIKLPDGRKAPVGSPELTRLLSDFLAQDVTVTREMDTPHFDDGAVHIILSSDLEKLQSLNPGSDADPRRFRANVILDTPGHMTAEDLLGRVLTIGSTRLKITHPTERCVMVTAKQHDLPSNPGILKAISNGEDVHFGVYASVLIPGKIEVGQAVDTSAKPGGNAANSRRKFGL